MAEVIMDPGAITTALRARERERHWAAVAQIGIGILSTLAIPAVLATLLLFAEHHEPAVAPARGQWWTWYCALAAILIPIAYIWEWQTKGGFLSKRLWDIKFDNGGWYESITRDRTCRWDAYGAAAQWEVILFAPRMVFEGIARLGNMSGAAQAQRSRCTELLCVLLRADHGLKVEDLMRQDEDAVGFSRAVLYLALYDWAGVASDGRKIWALSDARRDLGLK